MAPEVKGKHQADIYTVNDEPRSLTPADLAFVCQYTGKPSEIISPHVLAIWRMTKEQCWVFKCIEDFYFLQPKISLHPHYAAVQAAHRKQPQATRLRHADIGCCFGQDIRQLVADGWNNEELIAIDLVPDYWNMGEKLFMDEGRLHVPFLAGSMTDDAFLSSSTGHLLGQVDFIWAAAVLHVLSRQECEVFLRNTKQLLKPGGSVYGWTVGNAEPRDWVATPDGKQKRYLHSTESLQALLLHVGFSSATVELSAPGMWGSGSDQPGRLVMHFSATN